MAEGCREECCGEGVRGSSLRGGECGPTNFSVARDGCGASRLAESPPVVARAGGERI